MQWRRLGTQKGPRSRGGQPPRGKNGGGGWKVGVQRGLRDRGAGWWAGDLAKAEGPAKAKGVGQGLCEGQGCGWGTPRWV